MRAVDIKVKALNARNAVKVTHTPTGIQFNGFSDTSREDARQIAMVGLRKAVAKHNISKVNHYA